APVAILLPEDVKVTIDRDSLGNPTRIERRDQAGHYPAVERRYYYDTNLRLCATVEPESGTTVQDYDDSGNVSWVARGTTVAQCDRAAVAAADRTNFGYDLRNRVTHVTYPSPSTTPGITQDYH